MLMNVDLVDSYAQQAAERGAQILVLPEDFVSSFGGGNGNLAHFSIRLPARHRPICDEADAHVSPVARALACVAKRRGLVVAVGLGITAPCTPRDEPFSGRPMPCARTTRVGHFDGIAAFGPDGSLLGSARRRHLGYTWTYNAEGWMEATAGDAAATPAAAAAAAAATEEAEEGTFDAPFGVRFGLLVDSDIAFGDPMLSHMRRGAGDLI